MQNKGEYKWLFYEKNEASHKYYEGGAHFKYLDLFNALKNLSKKKFLFKNKKRKKTFIITRKK